MVFKKRPFIATSDYKNIDTIRLLLKNGFYKDIAKIHYPEFQHMIEVEDRNNPGTMFTFWYTKVQVPRTIVYYERKKAPKKSEEKDIDKEQ